MKIVKTMFFLTKKDCFGKKNCKDKKIDINIYSHFYIILRLLIKNNIL
jgi:hypothetical protein